jgi:hypothetical protein
MNGNGSRKNRRISVEQPIEGTVADGLRNNSVRRNMNTKDGLNSATVSGWINKRPNSIKDIASKESISTGIKRAKARILLKKKTRQTNISYLDEIIVMGERVILNENNISRELQDANKGGAVYFTSSYFPEEKSLPRIILAKTVFSKVFGPGSVFTVENPVPPCEVSEYNLLKEGLENRLDGLRNSLPSTFRDDVVPMEVRTDFDKAMKFNSIIKAIEGNTQLCTNYELNLTSNKVNAVKGYGKTLTPIDKERIENLLRQFSFIILQSIHPLDGYQNEQSINPNYFIAQLETQQISKDIMDEYLAEYAQSSVEVPELIVHALEATDTQNNLYSTMLESELVNLISYLKKSIVDNLADPVLKTKFSVFVNSIDDVSVKEQMIKIIKWLISEYKNNMSIISKHTEIINSNRVSGNVLSNELTAAKNRINDLEAKLYAKGLEHETTKKELEKSSESLTGIKNEETEKSTDTNNDIKELTDLLVKAKSEKDTLQEMLRNKNKTIGESMSTMVQAEESASVLQRAISSSNPSVSMGFLTHIKSIAESIKRGEKPVIIANDPFNNLYETFKKHSTEMSSSELCYLNYYITFFIKQIFGNNIEVYNSMNTLIETFLEKNASSLNIDTIIAELYNLLDLSEKVIATKAGYYIGKDTNVSSSFLKLLYEETKKNKSIVGVATNAVKTIFPGYVRREQFIYFIPPPSLSIQYNGFFIRERLSPKVIPVYSWNGTEFQESEQTSDITPEIFRKVELSYATLFMYYILFAKSYLVKMTHQLNKNNCSLPKFFTNSQLLKRPFRAPIRVVDATADVTNDLVQKLEK